MTSQPGTAVAVPMTGAAAWRRTLEIKRSFVENGDPLRLPPRSCAVRPEILLSWRRSMLGGVDWAGTGLPRDERHQGRSQPDRLVQAARPVLARLAGHLAGLHAWAFLTDGNCRLITWVVGDPALEPQLEARGAAPGALFCEDLVGTNGLGTTAEERQPFIVAGSEHFREHESRVTTAGAPVRDPVTKRLLGLININCRYEHTNALLLPFVTELAHAIEARLRPVWGGGEQALFEEFSRASADRSRAVVAFSGEILIANGAARRLLRTTDYEVLRRWALSAGSTVPPGAYGAPPGDAGTELLLAGGRAIARCQPAGQARREPGVVVTLTPSGWGAGAVTPAAYAGMRVPPMRRLREQLVRAHAARAAVLLRGERGTGKTTLARSLREDAGRRERFTEFDAADTAHGAAARCEPRDWMNRLRAAVDDPDATVLIRHLDMLAAPLTGPVMRLLDDPRARVVVTWAEDAAYPVGTAQPVGAAPGAGTAPTAGAALLFERFPVVLDVPPLRERAADIPSLVTAIITERLPRPPRPRCTPEALAVLSGRDWPGNVRELRQVVATALARSMSCDITVDDLPGGHSGSGERRLTKLERLERGALAMALRDAGWDVGAAAKDLGISRATIYRKLRSLGIQRPC